MIVSANALVFWILILFPSAKQSLQLSWTSHPHSESMLASGVTAGLVYFRQQLIEVLFLPQKSMKEKVNCSSPQLTPL